MHMIFRTGRRRKLRDENFFGIAIVNAEEDEGNSPLSPA